LSMAVVLPDFGLPVNANFTGINERNGLGLYQF